MTRAEHMAEVREMGLACMSTDEDHGHIGLTLLRQIQEAWTRNTEMTEDKPQKGEL